MLVCASCGRPYGVEHKFSCYVRGRWVTEKQYDDYVTEIVADISTYDDTGSDD